MYNDPATVMHTTSDLAYNQMAVDAWSMSDMLELRKIGYHFPFLTNLEADFVQRSREDHMNGNEITT